MKRSGFEFASDIAGTEFDSLNRYFLNRSHYYRLGNLDGIKITGKGGYFKRQLNIQYSNRTDEEDLTKVSGSHTLDGCYDRSGKRPVRVDEKVQISYGSEMVSLGESNEVLQGEVKMIFSNRDTFLINATPGDSSTAVVTLNRGRYPYASYSGSVPWDALLP